MVRETLTQTQDQLNFSWAKSISEFISDFVGPVGLRNLSCRVCGSLCRDTIIHIRWSSLFKSEGKFELFTQAFLLYSIPCQWVSFA